MQRLKSIPVIIALMFCVSPYIVTAYSDKPVAIDHYVKPAPNTVDEPIADEYSETRAIRAIDSAAMHWQDTRSCVTCHTNGLYLIARPAAGIDMPAYRDARKFSRDYLEEYTVDLKKSAGQRGAIEGIVATTAFKAISDIRTDGRLDDITKKALDFIWTRQDESGAWTDWLKCNWGPYESDDHFGVSLVALAMGIARDDAYVETPAAVAGVEKLRSYLNANPPSSLHQKAMTLWASTQLKGLAKQKERLQWQDDLLAAQKDDGGWVMIDLGDTSWKRSDGKQQDQHTDSYATAFIAYVLTESGIKRDDRRIVSAINWLKQNQRASGRWYTRSPRRDRKHYISNAASNFAVMLLASPESEAKSKN